MRELTSLIEEGSQWAGCMHELLLSMYKESGYGKAILKHPEPFLEDYDQICQQGQQQEPSLQPNVRGRPKKTRRNLLERFIQYKEAIVAFTLQQQVPFTSNQTEREAKNYARIQSFISTARKQKKHVFQQI